MAKAGARGAGQWWMKAAGMASAEGAKAAATDFATGSVSAAGGSRVRRGEEVVSSGDGGGWWRGDVEADGMWRLSCGLVGGEVGGASEAESGACGSGRASWRPVAVWSSG
uniref:DUF834 domain-containing protein n=1 Tax=Oryza rufipogon TaxID=4529 RepID=A0A0E0MQY7_ORYRU